MRAAFLSTRKRGAAVLAGIPRADAEFTVPALSIPRMERRVLGSIYGSARPSVDMPKLLNLYLNKKLKLDELVSRRIKLEEINSAFEWLEKGEVARSVIIY